MIGEQGHMSETLASLSQILLALAELYAPTEFHLDLYYHGV